MAKIKDGRKAPFLWADLRIITVYGSRMKPTGIAVYCCLAAHANQKRESFPSLQAIADEIGIARRTVVSVLQRLEAIGLIEVRQRTIPGRLEKRSNVYVLCDVPEPSLFDEPPGDPTAQESCAPGSPPGDPTAQESCAPGSPPGDPIALGGDPNARSSLCIELEPRNKNQGTNPEGASRAAHFDFDLTARGCAAAYIWYARGVPERERNLDMLAEVFEDLAAHGVPFGEIQAHIRDPSRAKSQYLWEFRGKWKEVFRGSSGGRAGADSGGHMGFHSRIGTTADKLAAIQARTIRAGQAGTLEGAGAAKAIPQAVQRPGDD